MFQADKEKRLKEIDKTFIKVAMLDVLGTVLLSLGLYAKFVANGDAFHPLLNKPNIVNVILLAGGVIMTWGIYKMITLSREKIALKNK